MLAIGIANMILLLFVGLSEHSASIEPIPYICFEDYEYGYNDTLSNGILIIPLDVNYFASPTPCEELGLDG